MKRRRLAYLALASVLVIAGALFGGRAVLRWDPDELGRPSRARAPELEADEMRAVTFNAWKLAQVERVPGAIAALETTASELGRGGDRGALPELFAVQEIESRAAARELRRALSPTHSVAICECAQASDGSLRSAVAIAADRRFFDLESKSCIALGRVWPDHPRCAARMTLEHDGEPLTAISVHMAWHVDNSEMAARLRDAMEPELRARSRIVVLGDFNAWQGTQAYRTLAREPLADSFPAGPPTHFTGGRIDWVLRGPGLRLVRGVDRRALYDALSPATDLYLPAACRAQGPPDCPVSDHLPEGAVLAITRRTAAARVATPNAL
jgi:hypothetical protein